MHENDCTKKTKFNRTFIIFFSIFIALTIILAIILVSPKEQLISTETYDLYDHTLGITDMTCTYVDENGQFINMEINYSYLEELVHLSKDTDKITIKNFGYNNEITRREIESISLTEETYNSITSSTLYGLNTFF